MPRSTSGHALLFYDRGGAGRGRPHRKSVAEAVLCRAASAVFGDAEWFRWTLVYNPGAAFGLHLGPYSRWIFLALTVGALGILYHLYRTTEDGNRWRVMAVGLVTAGAIGNLIDRIISPNGVVDFIDVGVGDMRWPTFNVADMAVSVGAILLAAVLWREDESAEHRGRRCSSVGAAVGGVGTRALMSDRLPGTDGVRDRGEQRCSPRFVGSHARRTVAHAGGDAHRQRARHAGRASREGVLQAGCWRIGRGVRPAAGPARDPWRGHPARGRVRGRAPAGDRQAGRWSHPAPGNWAGRW
jgi:signal peptidase II